MKSLMKQTLKEKKLDHCLKNSLFYKMELNTSDNNNFVPYRENLTV